MSLIQEIEIVLQTPLPTTEEGWQMLSLAWSFRSKAVDRNYVICLPLYFTMVGTYYSSTWRSWQAPSPLSHQIVWFLLRFGVQRVLNEDNFYFHSSTIFFPFFIFFYSSLPLPSILPFFLSLFPSFFLPLLSLSLCLSVSSFK